MESDSNEFFVKVPWGNIALVSWYEGSLEPVLMVHGRLDSATTFFPLVAQLPRNRQYVAVDLPGNGRSDAFPKGLPIKRFDFIAAIDFVVRHMGWKSFVYLGHSMGCEIGLYYNAVCPGRISKFVHLDAGPSFQRLQQPDFQFYYKNYFHKYYSNYDRYNGDTSKLYTKRQALDAVMKVRKLTEAQASIILSRALIQIGEDKYRLSWDPRMKFVAPLNITNDVNIHLFTRKQLPSLLINMSNGHGGHLRGKDGADQLIQAQMAAGNFLKIDLLGEHDHHVTDPDEMAKYIVGFLNNKDCNIKSKI